MLLKYIILLYTSICCSTDCMWSYLELQDFQICLSKVDRSEDNCSTVCQRSKVTKISLLLPSVANQFSKSTKAEIQAIMWIKTVTFVATMLQIRSIWIIPGKSRRPFYSARISDFLLLQSFCFKDFITQTNMQATIQYSIQYNVVHFLSIA